MKKIKLILSLGLLFFLSHAIAQTSKTLTGVVLEEKKDGKLEPLPFVNIFWLGTTSGTVSDQSGNFTIPYDSTKKWLIFSYVSYPNDTVFITKPDKITVILKNAKVFDEIEIKYKTKTTEISFIDPRQVKNMKEEELFKAACCNLSESFETNPSVDMAFTDAVTGTRQIQMLGLAGIYTQITQENLPSIRGLMAPYGLTFTPGPWVSSIQVSKGTGSVVNGFESMAGQINVELRKPEDKEKVFLNAYLNQNGRSEINAVFNNKVNKNWHSGLFIHASARPLKFDMNKDGFLDNPLGNQIGIINRWQYNNPKGYEGQFGVRFLYEDKQGGQVNFDPKNKANSPYYGVGINTRRYEAWSKTGYVFKEKKYQSIGLQLNGSKHTQNSYLGNTIYDADQESFYSNLIFQSIINNTMHKYKVGASFMYDKYREKFDSLNFNRLETVPGIFAEYTYDNLEKMTIVGGIRADYHNIFGLFITPRLHARFALNKNTVFRISAGRGQRTANIFADNMGYFISNRIPVIRSSSVNAAYGLKPEVVWNLGANITKNFKLNGRDGSLSVDYYRTFFTSQVIVDLEQNNRIVFYDLQGKSFSNSAQIELDYELFKRFDIRMAYRFYDVKSTYSGQLLERPLISRHRAFINLEYKIKGNWSFDLTAQWYGNRRMPYTGDKPEMYQLPSRTPGYFLLNGQISKTVFMNFDAYIGFENILNFQQKDPILAANTPQNENFDAGLIWGPVFGRMTYLGIRYKILK